MSRAWIAIALAVLTVAALVHPSDTQLTLFGWDIPVMCTFRRLTGWPCPGCGLTRSFVWMAHGHPIDALRMNLLGPPLFLALLAQIPLGIRRELRPGQPVGGERGERGVP